MTSMHDRWNINIDPGRLILIILALLAVWAIYISYSVDIEYSDGYATVANAQYLLGTSDLYFGQRAPFLAFWLVPAELFSEWLHLHPFDISLHHLSMAVLHIVYLLAVISVMRRGYDDVYVLIAFLAAVPNYIFFSYVPFINHDIFPGAILLGMLYLASSLVKRYTHRVWVALIVFGLIASLVKHFYAIFWIAVLLVYLFILPRHLGRKDALRLWLRLFAGALISGLISWFFYSWVLEGTMPDVPFLLRPFYQVVAILDMHPNEEHYSLFPWWLYWRNFSHGYGLLVSVLIVPGFYLAFKSKSVLMQSVAASWLLCFIGLHSLAFKEVRYLAILMPLTALLLLPVIKLFWSDKKWKYIRMGVLLLLMVDLSNAVSAAINTNMKFYRTHTVSKFLEPMEEYTDSRFVFTNTLSFTYKNGYSPIKGDRNHRLFHVIPEIIRQLYHYPASRVVELADFEEINHLKPGDVLFFSNTPLVRRPEEHIPMSRSAGRFWQFALKVVGSDSRDPDREYLQYVYDRKQHAFQFIPSSPDADGILFVMLGSDDDHQ